MKNKTNNFAYIDAANLHNGVNSLGWKLDYGRFRVWLEEKYGVQRVYMFIGLIPKNKYLYSYLQKVGYTLIFKEVVYDGDGKAKGNCDADLVVQMMVDSFENNFGKAIIVSSDGDYASLVRFLMEKKKLLTILSPSTDKKCSILLKRTDAPIAYINNQKSILEIQNKKAPDGDGTP